MTVYRNDIKSAKAATEAFIRGQTFYTKQNLPISRRDFSEGAKIVIVFNNGKSSCVLPL